MKEWLADFPSTNARIVVSLLMGMLTGLRVLFTGWDPPNDWLVFLTIWAGLDVSQYVGKRTTYKPSPPATHDVEDVAATPPPEEPEPDEPEEPREQTRRDRERAAEQLLRGDW